MRTKARSFAFAARFLDPERRHATEILYAFFRIVDDLVDERPPHTDPAPIAAKLDRWDAWLANPRDSHNPLAEDPLARALGRTLAAYAIPTSYLQALLLGLRDDLEGRPITTFADLERYSFRVAASVGLAMCHVLGATSTRALTAATALGIAMQLTNILRDVGDDLAHGRVYLPADELARFGGTDTLRAGAPSAPLRELLRFQIARARRYYAAGVHGIDELSPDVRFPILLAAWLYGRILDKIEAQDYDVLSRRAAVSRREKVVLASGLALRMRLGHALVAPPSWPSYEALGGSPLGPSALAELAGCGVRVIAGQTVPR